MHDERPSDAVPLSRAEYSHIDHFFYSAMRRLQRARDQAKELKNPALEVPDYPSNREEVFQVLPRLLTRFRTHGSPAP